MKDDVDDVACQNHHLPKLPAQLTLEVYRPFSEYLKSKYGDSEELINHNRQSELDLVFSLGIEKAKRELESPILFEGKKPRKDVMFTLGVIANTFQSFSTYPKIKSRVITNTIKKLLNSKDNRTVQKYSNCVRQYIGKPKELGLVDVSNFVNRIPEEVLDLTSSTSSFGEDNIGN